METATCLILTETREEEEDLETFDVSPPFQIVDSSSTSTTAATISPALEEQIDKKKKKERNPKPGESTVDFLLRIDPSGKKLRTHVLYLESRLADRELNAKLTDIESLTQNLQWYASRSHYIGLNIDPQTGLYKGEQPDVLADNGNRARTVLEAVKQARQKEAQTNGV